jgi:hypothetical protein
MANPVIKGTQALWGVGSIYTGIVVSARIKRTGEEDYIYDGNGFTITDILFDDRDEGEVNVICQSDTTIPARGAVITVNSVATFIVHATELMWEQRGWKKLKIAAKNFVNLTP